MWGKIKKKKYGTDILLNVKNKEHTCRNVFIVYITCNFLKKKKKNQKTNKQNKNKKNKQTNKQTNLFILKNTDDY
jgi:hypothetical protein